MYIYNIYIYIYIYICICRYITSTAYPTGLKYVNMSSISASFEHSTTNQITQMLSTVRSSPQVAVRFSYLANMTRMKNIASANDPKCVF